jgi:hypothetical protein
LSILSAGKLRTCYRIDQRFLIKVQRRASSKLRDRGDIDLPSGGDNELQDVSAA